MALSLPPSLATIFENSPGGISPVPLNIRCSRKCGRPDLPKGLSAVPTRYQTQCATTGALRFGTTTTSMPLSSAKVCGLKSEAGTSSGAAASVRAAGAPGCWWSEALNWFSSGCRRERGAPGAHGDDAAGRARAQARGLGRRVQDLVRRLELLLLEVEDGEEGALADPLELARLGHDPVADAGLGRDRARRNQRPLALAERARALRRRGDAVGAGEQPAGLRGRVRL